MKKILDLWSNIHTYLEDPTVRTYFSILEIDPTKFTFDDVDTYHIESKKLINALLFNPIGSHLLKYIKTKKSKLSYLSLFSPEQIAFITNGSRIPTKLIACAGSGKTRSLIGRIRFLVEHSLVKKSEVYMITFSRSAAIDFKNKIASLFPSYESFANIVNFSTIDSLAKSILCKGRPHKSENVEILSIAFRNYLQEITPEEIFLIKKTKNISHLFIDEAQDLNEIQADIIKLLEKKFSTICELSGDPNQNIYQFRRSNSSYLLNYPGKRFDLRLNFRSTQQIIDFSECIKPLKTLRSVSAKNKNGPIIQIINQPSSVINNKILQIIKSTKFDLSEIAIICPTRGIGTFDSIGLANIFNFLKYHKIPLNQQYDESGLNDEKRKLSGKIPLHLNLLTYHGTKGLEFEIVIVLDFYYFLFNIKPTEAENRIHQYLLYVATSRASSQMFICCNTNVHGGFINHVISTIDPKLYTSDTPIKIPVLTFRVDQKPQINAITEIIIELTDLQLNLIDDMLEIIPAEDSFTKRIYPDHTHIDRSNDEALFGIFCEELFYLQYFLYKNLPPRKLSLIESIIESEYVVITDESDCKLLKKFIKQNLLTWEFFDKNKFQLPHRISTLIEKNFDRNTEIHNSVICTNEFINIIKLNITSIRSAYANYLGSKYQSYKEILPDFFYLIVVSYAYDINHYFYINNRGIEKYSLVDVGSNLFEQINQFIQSDQIQDIQAKIFISYDKLSLNGEIDFIEKISDSDEEIIVEIKCVKEISIRYYIQLLLYNFCYYYQTNTTKLYRNKFKIINLLTGLIHNVIISITPSNMFELLHTISEIGNLKFNSMNLIYDLETTDKIIEKGPYNFAPKIPRTKIYKKGNKFFYICYPHIIEICIKDYQTNMIIINTLVNPPEQLNPIVEQITHLTNIQLKDSPTINTIRTILRKRLENFTNSKLLAHNGNRFDNKIIITDDLVDLNNITFLDTLQIIPMHMPIKLKNKSLEQIHIQVFGQSYPSHRAEADVDALIRIMKKINVEL